MNNDRDLLKMALEALELGDAADAISVGELMDAIREALAQPEQEPVAWKDRTYGNLHHQDFGNSIPLYTTPQPNTIANSEAIPEQISEPVAWRDHVEQRLLTWRQSFVNRSGDQLALDDFMDKESLDDLIDYVCDEYTTPPRREWVGISDEEWQDLSDRYGLIIFGSFKEEVEAKLREKNA